MTRQPLRRAGPADVPAIRALSRRAYEKWVGLIGREPIPMIADYEAAIRTHIFDLIEEHGRLIALVETAREADHLLVVNLAVDPDYQGQGLGDRLLGQAEETARHESYGEVRLYTNAAFTSNIAFYEKRGYREFERRSLGPGMMRIYMRKTLAG